MNINNTNKCTIQIVDKISSHASNCNYSPVIVNPIRKALASSILINSQAWLLICVFTHQLTPGVRCFPTFVKWGSINIKLRFLDYEWIPHSVIDLITTGLAVPWWPCSHSVMFPVDTPSHDYSLLFYPTSSRIRCKLQQHSHVRKARHCWICL